VVLDQGQGVLPEGSSPASSARTTASNSLLGSPDGPRDRTGVRDGRDAKDVSAEDAWDHIFGYTILLDVSIRGDQDRSNHKSYDTFTVIGPCVVTADEIDDPQDLQMELRLNSERRQYENTGDMVYTCADVVQYASLGATLERGDVITTGTPEGVSELTDGDTIEADIEDVGSMTVDVTGRDVSYADADVTKGSED